MSKLQKRVQWLTEHRQKIQALKTPQCPKNCKAKCHNGATCATQSSGGYGWWLQALNAANIPVKVLNYWSGSNPTPSTSINLEIANYIYKFAPERLK